MNLGPTELMIVLVIVLVIFGGSKLPKLARSLGDARREFEKANDDAEREKLAVPPPTADPVDRAVADARLDAEARAQAAERDAEMARREADLLRREAELRDRETH